MASHLPISISGLTYHLGGLESVDSISEIGSRPESLSRLLSRGLRQFSHISGPMEHPIEECVRRSLLSASVSPSDIDILVYAPGMWTQKEGRCIVSVVDHLFLNHVDLVTLGFSLCHTYQAAVRVASGLLREAGGGLALAVVSNQIAADSERIAPLDITVFSDAIASCVVRADHLGDFSLVGSAEGLSLVDERSANVWEGARSQLRRMVFLCEQALKRGGISLSDVRTILFSNMNLGLMKLYMEQLGRQGSEMFDRNIPRIGHAGGCDVAINLADHLSDGLLCRGDKVLLAGNSDNAWGVLILEMLKASGGGV